MERDDDEDDRMMVEEIERLRHEASGSAIEQESRGGSAAHEAPVHAGSERSLGISLEIKVTESNDPTGSISMSSASAPVKSKMEIKRAYSGELFSDSCLLSLKPPQ